MGKIRTVIFFLFIVFSLLLPSTASAAGSCDYPKLCDLRSATAAKPEGPKPGDPCVIDGVTDYVDLKTGEKKQFDYSYDTTNHCGILGIDWLKNDGPCVPSCGFLGMGKCCVPKAKPAPDPAKTSQAAPCETYGDDKKNQGCLSVNTAFGVIKTDAPGLVQSLFTILLGFSGGVALLLVIAAGYQMMASQGNPEKVKEGRERLIAAIVGLLFIIFSTAILQIIGVDLLHLPGFSR